MSDTQQDKERAVIQENAVIPSQVSAIDTSNQDNKISVDHSGEKYIRTIDENELA